MDTVVWAATGVLAALMLVAGATKALSSMSRLHETGLTYVEDLPAWFIRTLGVAEVLGAVVLVLPGVLDVATVLVPIAAVCLAITMVGAVVVHVRRAELSSLALPIGLLVLAVFVAVARFGPWPL